MALKRLTQIGCKVEASAGTEETLTATEYAGNFKDTTIKYSIGEYERALDKAALSMDAQLKGARMLTIGTTCEAVGGSAASAPPWHDMLKSCGFAVSTLKSIAVGTVTGGTFVYGDIIGNNTVFGSATKTGIFVRYVAGSPNKICYLPVTGTFASADVISNYATSQVSATASAAAVNVGYRFALQSETDAVTPASVTVDVRMGGQRHTAVGAVGKVSFELKHQSPLLMKFEFQGLPVLSANAPRTASLITGIAALGVAPRVAIGFPCVIDAYSPILTSLGLAVENTIAPRPTIGTGIGTVTDCGYLPPRITARKVTATVDPEQPAVATKEFYVKANTGATFALNAEVGQAGDTNGVLIFGGPTVQINGDQEPSDRDGIIIRNLTLGMFGTPGQLNDELTIDQVFI